MAGSGAVGVCSSGFSSAGVSFLGSGAGFFSVFVCVCVFVCGAADSDVPSEYQEGLTDGFDRAEAAFRDIFDVKEQ